MRNDVPAALPLIGLVAGLAAGPLLVHPHLTIGLLVVAGLLPLRLPARVALFAAAAAVAIALVEHRQQTTEDRLFRKLGTETFVTIEVPLERDWSLRNRSHLLRATSFRADGLTFDAPIALYARFDPPEIAMEAILRADVLLRVSDRGGYTGTIKSEALMDYDGALPRWHPAAWNRYLANRLERFATDFPDEVALAQALALGRGERLSEEQKENFRRGGTYHLLVFSGLQIAFAAGLLAALLRWLHAPRASDWLLLSFAGLAPLFIGPTASVSRASIAIGLYALSRILRRPTSIENLWCVAAALRLLVEPAELTDVSFHLTYAGAGALLFIGKHLFARRWLGHAFAAEIVIAPITLFHFHQYVIGGSLLTLLMSPLILAMLVVSTVACVFPSTLRAITPLHALCTRLNDVGLSGYLAAPPGWLLSGCALGALIVIASRGGRTRAILLTAILSVASFSAILTSHRGRKVAEPQVTFFDVGQGDAIAIRSGASTVLVDGGPDLRLLPLLAQRGIRSIDAVFLTHAHPDHCGALAAVLTELEVGRLYVSPRRLRGDCATRLLEASSLSSTPVHTLDDEEELTIGALRIRAHLPAVRFRRAPENNASVVLHVTAGERSFLLTGDVEREAEIHLEDRDLHADVLKVAHHGSRSSTADSFLAQVRPRMAVISCGRRNLFGHPHPDVLGTLRGRHVQTLRTDLSGTIEMTVSEGRLYVQPGRD